MQLGVIIWIVQQLFDRSAKDFAAAHQTDLRVLERRADAAARRNQAADRKVAALHRIGARRRHAADQFNRICTAFVQAQLHLHRCDDNFQL